MGNSQTKEPADFESGIYVTPGLIAQLQGKPYRRKGSSQHHGLPSLPFAQSLEQAVSKRMRQDQELRQALEESKMAGELLLKAEGEELKRVRQFANDLIQKEYSVPSQEAPCLQQQEDVLNCYTAHRENPLVCGGAVDAYAQCADLARRVYADSHHSSRLAKS